MSAAFWSRVDASGDCWVWMGGTSGEGYGRYYLGGGRNNGRNTAAHRYAWQLLVGSIPKGLALDHLCLNKRCVNPDHLEPVTWAENNRRAPWVGRMARAALVRRAQTITHCPAGHPYAGNNLYVYRGHRRCRECNRIRNLTNRRRAKENT